MKLLHISLFVVLLLAVTVEGAKKRKNNNRDRDNEPSSRQVEEDQLSARKEDETVLRQKENKQKEKKEKEEKPLKKAEDESSSEEEEEKKENKTTVVPSRLKRRLHEDEHAIRASFILYRLKRAESTLKKAKEHDQLPMNSHDAENVRSGRSRRAENTLHKAKELDDLPLNDHHQHGEHPPRHRPKRAENTLQKAKEMDQIPLKPSNNEQSQKSRRRRAENSHAQTGEVLSRAQELNDGERTPLVIDENAGSLPDYRKKSNSRTRRQGEMVLGKTQELNGGDRTELAKEQTEAAATRPDYRKNSRTRRTLQHRRYARVRRTNVGSSEENTLKKAEELNDGVQRPVDKLPSQSQMPDEKVKAHKRRSPRELFQSRNMPGNQDDERDTEEWRKENEADYDDGNNS